jgi:hypothetical protein
MYYIVIVHDEKYQYPLVRFCSSESKEITTCVEKLINNDEYSVDNIEIAEISYCHVSKSTENNKLCFIF